MRLICFNLLVVLIWSGRFAGTEAFAESAATSIAFNVPMLFSYGSWEFDVRHQVGCMQLTGDNGKGGGGYNKNLVLTESIGQAPVLHLTIGEKNKARAIKVLFLDTDGKKAIFRYSLTSEKRSVPLQLEPASGAVIDKPDEGESISLARVRQVQVVGDWGNEPIDVCVDRLVLAKRDPKEIPEESENSAERKAERAAALRATLSARKGIKHSDSSPTVERVYAVDRNVLAIAIVEGVLQRTALEPYERLTGDSISEKGNQVEIVQDGKVAVSPITRVLRRKLNGSLRDVGYLAGGRLDSSELYVFPYESVIGDKLEIRTVMDRESYQIRSTTDAGFKNGVQPVEVYRKSKPLNKALPNNEQVVRHIIYLVLPESLREGQDYEVSFLHVNTRESKVVYRHNSREVRTEVIHTNHIGYRPDDPYKRAFLSLWMGDKRSHKYDNCPRFEVIDDHGISVFQGQIVKVLEVNGKEPVRPPKNLSETAVYAMDFSDVSKPGNYLVHVPGIGVSYPVTIARDVWKNSFRKSMHGFLCQRSGIKLGPPFTSFVRERTFHPEDGVKIYQSSTTGGEAFDKSKFPDWFAGLVAGRTEEIVAGAWGGYNDAGDFDRAANHLWATYLHLELADLFPKYFEELALALPPNEAGDEIPDLINEALWNLDLFYRMQEKNGGITAGLESSRHPRKGEDSVRDSLVLMAYEPDANSSYIYAAVASRAARILNKYDKTRADQLRESAVRAFEFAEKTPDSRKGYNGRPLADVRNVAAAELLMLTHKPRFDEVFKETNPWEKPQAVIDAQGGGFTYVRLPKGVGDEKMKAAIMATMLKQANSALKYASENAFGLTSEIRDIPLIGPVGAFTVPGMNSRILPRVHYLTGKEKYLAGIVRSCNFSAGANPDNRSFTTGVGYDPPIAPLHFDSRLTGQEAPDGLTLYGAYEHESSSAMTAYSEWVHKWMLPKTMYPPSRTWPVTESYVDLFLWPMMNEFTICQNMGPTSYTWGYLAARDSTAHAD